jgi:purine-binding chemotaxis protein CheW
MTVSDDWLAILRRNFDGAFALPAAAVGAGCEEFLVIRAGGIRHAVRIAQAAGLERRIRLVALPGAPASLLGIAGLHRQLVPVHDLSRLLGLGSDPALEGDRAAWVLLAAGIDGSLVGLALDGYDGFVRSGHRQVVAAAGGLGIAGGVLDLPGGRLHILDLPPLIAGIPVSAAPAAARE